MCADALPIQPVVLSRGKRMPAMGIESSGAVGGGCGWWGVRVVVCFPRRLEHGSGGEMSTPDAGGMVSGTCPDTRVVGGHVSLGQGVGIVEERTRVHDELT
jgi:hypothetical protein